MVSEVEYQPPGPTVSDDDLRRLSAQFSRHTARQQRARSNDTMSKYDHLIAAQTARIDALVANVAEYETALLGVLDTVSTLADIIAGLKAERMTAPAQTATTLAARSAVTTRTTTSKTAPKPKHDKAQEGIVTGTVVRTAREGYGLVVLTTTGNVWVNCVKSGPALFKNMTEGQQVSYRVKAGGIVVTNDKAA